MREEGDDGWVINAGKGAMERDAGKRSRGFGENGMATGSDARERWARKRCKENPAVEVGRRRQRIEVAIAALGGRD
ncbi:hypothetical protein K438DRAFT_1859223, partial [Mycena galopus ATCC 62051]